MTKAVEKVAAEVSALPEKELDELLAWLAEFESQRTDAWDQAIAADSSPGGRLQGVLDRAKEDVAAGRTKPLSLHSRSWQCPRSWGDYRASNALLGYGVPPKH